MGEDSKRPRGILTQADREFLTGQRDLTEQSARNRRRRIRNRVLSSLLDFSLLWAILPERDLELIFSADTDEKRHMIRTSVQDMIAFSILGLWENDDYYPPRVEYAIKQAGYARNRNVSVNLDVNEELMDSSENTVRKFIEGGFEHTTYEEWEKAITDPEVEPELVAKCLAVANPDEDLSIEEVEALQEAYKETTAVRPIPPKVVNVEHIFKDQVADEN